MKLEEELYCFIASTEDVERGSFITHVLHCSTQVGHINFKFWDLKKRDLFPVPGEYLKIRVTDLESASQELSKWKTLSLDSTSKNKPYFCEYTILEEEEVPPQIRELINRDRSCQLKFALELLHDESYWVDKNVHKFLNEFVDTYSEKFKTVPAAIGHHHNYEGGLCIHSSEVFSNSYAIVNSPCNKKFYSSQVNTDSLYLSSWIHDIGKIEVYYMENDSPKINSDKENLIGHSTISNVMFAEFSKKFGLEDELCQRVSHNILSHHRRKKWGAVVKPNTVEAHILCDSDLISSRISN